MRTRPHRRPDPRRALRRDLSGYTRREPGHRSFWRSLGVLGMVGWPIVLLTVGGALLGRILDGRWGSGIRFTLMLLTLGALIGSVVAWHALAPRTGERP